MVDAGALKACPAQMLAMKRLAGLRAELVKHGERLREYEREKARHAERRKEVLAELEEMAKKREHEEAPPPTKAAWWPAFLAERAAKRKAADAEEAKRKQAAEREAEADRRVGPTPVRPAAPVGTYLYGDVGAGKSLALDMFAASLPAEAMHVRRVHFHAAMLEISHRLHANRQHESEETKDGRDPDAARKAARAALLALRRRARQGTATAPSDQSVASEMKRVALEMLDVDEQPDVPVVICLDEMQVPDAFACVALRALLATLRNHAGAAIVTTSNSAPAQLNRAGVAPESFAALLSTLTAACEPHALDAGVDHREEAARGIDFRAPANSASAPERYLLAGETSSGALRARFDAHCAAHGGGEPMWERVPVMFNRTLDVQLAHVPSRSAYFTFDELCAKPLGPADYCALASQYEHVFLDGVPQMDASRAAEARRFITLLDELYNLRRLLSVCAEAVPHELFAPDVAKVDTASVAEATQFESTAIADDAGGMRLRRDVGVAAGRVAADARSVLSLDSGSEERFAFARAVSRLVEMQSGAYVERAVSFTIGGGGGGGNQGVAV